MDQCQFNGVLTLNRLIVRLQNWLVNVLRSLKEPLLTDKQIDLLENLVGGMGKAEVNLTKGLVRRLLKIEDHIVQDRLGWKRVSWWLCPGSWKMCWWLFWGNNGGEVLERNELGWWSHLPVMRLVIKILLWQTVVSMIWPTTSNQFTCWCWCFTTWSQRWW